MRKILSFYLIIFSACTDRVSTEGQTLVVPIIKSTNGNPPPPPPCPYCYYDCFNFIFDSIGTLYFYQHSYDSNITPVHVIDFDSYKPVFINLNPDDISVIPEDAVKNFIKSNILSPNQFCRTVRVIGVKDTIKSKCLAPLMDILTDRANHICYSIRKTTLEETVVLDYKKRQEFFYPDKITWDSTKIWFDKNPN